MILLIYTIFTVIAGSDGDSSPEAATLKKKVIKGIQKQTGKFKNLKGIESKMLP